MRRPLAAVAVGTLVMALSAPTAAAEPVPTPEREIVRGQDHDGSGYGSDDDRYRHHERYEGDYYDYNEHRGSDPYTEAGPYDGYYHCRRYDTPTRSETWCDHYYGREPEQGY